MIINITESIAVSLESDCTRENPSVIALDIVVQSYLEGNHVLFADFSVYEKILRVGSDFLGARTYNALRRARDKSVQYGALFEKSLYVINLVSSGAGVSCENMNGKTWITIPDSYASGCASLFDKSIFIVENLSDAEFYTKLSGAVESSILGVKSRVNWESAPGGGNTVGDLYGYHKRERRRIGLCVVDSDIRFEGCDVGDTAKRVLAIDSEATGPLLYAHIISHRAAENIIPACVILDASDKVGAEARARSERIVGEHYGRPYWKYIPLKKGVKCFDLINSSAGEFSYFRGYVSRGSCQSNGACDERCSSYVIEKINFDMLKKTAEADWSKVGLDAIDADMRLEWSILSAKVISFFCCDQRSLAF